MKKPVEWKKEEDGLGYNNILTCFYAYVVDTRMIWLYEENVFGFAMVSEGRSFCIQIYDVVDDVGEDCLYILDF